jgi:hypothetical protein
LKVLSSPLRHASMSPATISRPSSGCTPFFCRKAAKNQAIYLACILSLAACSLFTESSEAPDGVYAMSKLGDSLLPVHLSELPDPNGQPSGCWYTLTEGSLQLISSERWFGYSLLYRNSCTAEVLESTGASGSFARHGSALTFTISAQDGDVSFPGIYTGNVLIVQRSPQFTYTFERP